MPLKQCLFTSVFRVDISDTLMYVYEMLGAELLSNLYDKLGRLLTNAEQPTSWQVGETDTRSKQKIYTMFCFYECCAEYLTLHTFFLCFT